jgi:hypothetical protein
MLISLTILSLVSVAFYLIRVGGKLQDAKLSDEAIRDIQKAYKLEKREDEAIREKLDGNNTDPNSIASLFPDELHGLEEKRRDNANIHPAPVTKD